MWQTVFEALEWDGRVCFQIREYLLSVAPQPEGLVSPVAGSQGVTAAHEDSDVDSSDDDIVLKRGNLDDVGTIVRPGSVIQYHARVCGVCSHTGRFED
jgi:hypothetical protein